jgi:hypothetical protein
MYPTGHPVDMRIFGLRWHPWLWAMNPINMACLDYPYGEFIVYASTMSNFVPTTGWEKDKNDVKTLLVKLIPLRAVFGHVKDEDDDGYALSLQNGLESMHSRMPSAFLRNYSPINPPLPPLPTDVNMNTLIADFSKIGSEIPKRRGRRFGKQRSE